VTPRLATVAALTAADRRRMHALLDRFVAGVTPERFAADLEAKTHALLLEHEGGDLVGFSTLRYDPDAAGAGEEPLNVITSGDTIVDPAGWGASLLAPAWIAAVRHLHRGHPGQRLVWLLIASGFRTYRFLPVFWRDFAPRHDRPTTAAERALMERLAGERFGACYDPAAGVVRFAEPQVLRDGLGGIPQGRLADPHVAFFTHANPGHARGDELVCLADLGDHNLTPAGRRAVRRGDLGGWIGGRDDGGSTR
jgi:hypothetical protein